MSHPRMAHNKDPSAETSVHNVKSENRFLTYHRICQKFYAHNDFSHGITFPYDCYKFTKFHHQRPLLPDLKCSILLCSQQLIQKLIPIQKVYATVESSSTDSSVAGSRMDNSLETAGSGNIKGEYIEMLAKEYITKETGRERVYQIFQKDHKGSFSPEMQYIYLALLQTFVVCFIVKHGPEWRLAKKDFIRENNATVFRTNIEAARRMNDYVTVRASMAAVKFSSKITIFSASFLFLSQMIASYRNKTSVLEYSLGGGITGGLARINLGLKGFISGSVVGATLGSVIGVAAYFIFTGFNLTQDQRHFDYIKSKIEVQRYIAEEEVFQQKLKQISEQHITSSGII